MLKKIFSYSLVEAISKSLNKALIILIPLIISSSNFGKIGIIISIEIIIPIFPKLLELIIKGIKMIKALFKLFDIASTKLYENIFFSI